MNKKNERMTVGLIAAVIAVVCTIFAVIMIANEVAIRLGWH